MSFEWRQERLLPLFQFETPDMSVHARASQVIRELVDAFDDWKVAQWFAQPNSALHGDPAAVLRAARTDRYIARG